MLALVATVSLTLAGCFNSGPTPPPPAAAAAAAQQRAAEDAARKAAAAKAAAEQASREKAEREAAQREQAERETAARELRERQHREESSQRLVLFTPGGPLVARIYLTLDGQPFRQKLSEQVDALEPLADTDGDGRGTWSEAAANRKFKIGPFDRAADAPPPDEDESADLIKPWDINRDGTADRDELFRLVERTERKTSDFVLEDDPYARGQDRYDSVVWRLLDADTDGLIGDGDQAAAEAALKSRDADDDDLLYPEELTAAPAMAMQPGMMPDRSDPAGPPTVLSLDQRANWSTIRYTLQEEYGWNVDEAAEGPAWFAHLAKQLDADDNGQVEPDEFDALTTIVPQIDIEAHFGTGDQPKDVTLVALAGDLAAAGLSPTLVPGGFAIEPAGVKLRFITNDPPPVDYQQLAQQQLATLDADKNGYIEKSEIPAGAGDAGDNFMQADADNNGKLYPEEIAAFAEKQAPPRRRIRASTAGQGDALFVALDASNDGRLSLREMRTAAARLRALDLDGDGALSSDEVPSSIGLSLARVAEDTGMNPQQPQAMAVAARPPPPVSGPPWFIRMDSNGDGDVSPREFLGDTDQFRQFDADGNGFLDAAEAGKATPEA